MAHIKELKGEENRLSICGLEATNEARRVPCSLQATVPVRSLKP